MAQEDHAIRACYAALRMQQRITAYGDEVQRAHGIPILIRVGLNSGEVVLRPLGSDPSALSAVGQTVHLASRLEQLAKPGTVLASADTVAMTGRRVRTRPLGPVNIKGLAEPVEVFEVVGGVSSTLRAESGRRVPPPLIGREADLARLTAALDSVSRGAAQFVALGGEAGIGKSRLVDEFAAISRARGAVVFGAKAQPYTRATGRRIGLDLLRSYFGLDRGRRARGRARQGRRRDARARSGARPRTSRRCSGSSAPSRRGDPFLRADAPSRPPARIRGELPPHRRDGAPPALRPRHRQPPVGRPRRGGVAQAVRERAHAVDPRPRDISARVRRRRGSRARTPCALHLGALPPDRRRRICSTPCSAPTRSCSRSSGS